MIPRRTLKHKYTDTPRSGLGIGTTHGRRHLPFP